MHASLAQTRRVLALSLLLTPLSLLWTSHVMGAARSLGMHAVSGLSREAISVQVYSLVATAAVAVVLGIFRGAWVTRSLREVASELDGASAPTRLEALAARTPILRYVLEDHWLDRLVIALHPVHSEQRWRRTLVRLSCALPLLAVAVSGLAGVTLVVDTGIYPLVSVLEASMLLVLAVARTSVFGAMWIAAREEAHLGQRTTTHPAAGVQPAAAFASVTSA
jgi:hypothetical protein